MRKLCKLNSQGNDRIQKTKLLLMIYRKVVWRIADSLYDLNETIREFGSSYLSNLVELLSINLNDFEPIKDKEALEIRLTNIVGSKTMIEIIDKALLKLKSHPDKGEIYFKIIKDSYISQTKLSDNQIIHKNQLTHATYYRYKKKAIELMDFILWGYQLPNLEVKEDATRLHCDSKLIVK